ncbi:MAG TPA: alkaline phosphatase family protein [Nitrospiraceae bacterium]|nr:alkaline phosphatase family protein [Nitrospiraceae bacterium]
MAVTRDRFTSFRLTRTISSYVLPALYLVFLLIGLNGCHRLLPTQHAADPVLHGVLNDHPIEHVVVFAVDGLEHETLVKYLRQSPSRKPGGLHDLFGVRAEGNSLVFTKGMAVQQPTTVFPSYTYPAWTSMFTGVFPGAHGIAGNSVFFRERALARYYTEYHLDAVKVQLAEDFLSDDMNGQVKTLYEYIAQQGGQSLVVHHMLTRGSGRGAINADFDTLLSYTQNRSAAVDENALWEAVRALQNFNGAVTDGGELRLPSLMTIYFAGLDHAEHLSPEDPEQARVAYLKHLDDLIAKFIAGDRAIVRQHHATPFSEVTPIDPIQWRGLRDESVMGRTLFVFVSDHGHTPIEWNKALGVDDLKIVFDELNVTRGKAYRLEMPSLIDETPLSKVRASFGLVSNGRISGDSNVVATLNGGALGFYVKPSAGQWKDNPDYQGDIVPMLEHLLLTLHKNEQGPEAVLYKHGSGYVYIPYQYDGATVHLLPAVVLDQSPLNTDAYPMAVRRLNGLASRLPTDPLSAPDIILLADRAKHLTYLNKQDGRVLEKLDVTTHRHFHSDHGHLNASDSLVPMMFVRGGQEGRDALGAICEASLVDITPTILDILGLLPSFEAAMQNRPDEVKGHSLKPAMDRILTKAPPMVSGNVCASPHTIRRPSID